MATPQHQVSHKCRDMVSQKPWNLRPLRAPRVVEVPAVDTEQSVVGPDRHGRARTLGRVQERVDGLSASHGMADADLA